MDLPAPGGGIASILCRDASRPLRPVFAAWGDPSLSLCLLVVDRAGLLVLLVGGVAPKVAGGGCADAAAVGRGNRRGMAPFPVAYLCASRHFQVCGPTFQACLPESFGVGKSLSTAGASAITLSCDSQSVSQSVVGSRSCTARWDGMVSGEWSLSTDRWWPARQGFRWRPFASLWPVTKNRNSKESRRV